MHCPHCQVAFHDTPAERWLGVDADGGWLLVTHRCPACSRISMELVSGQVGYLAGRDGSRDPLIISQQRRIWAWPRLAALKPSPPEVPRDFADDLAEAATVLEASPKASAAMSRRCLQRLLRDVAHVNASDLANEIQDVIGSKLLPADLADDIDAIRVVGNFAAHPIKSTISGVIVDVEPGEAELTLHVLADLFDWYFVRPARRAEQRAGINQKLQEAGKPPLKQGSPADGTP